MPADDECCWPTDRSGVISAQAVDEQALKWTHHPEADHQAQ